MPSNFMNSLNRTSKQEYDDLELLPVFHTTDMYFARDILREGMIKREKCPVFNEDLVYLFYGVPAYISSRAAQNIETTFPICFLFNNIPIDSVKRIFPFDTGAFESKRYKEFIEERFTKENFEVEPTVRSIRKLVGSLFGNNTNYYWGYLKHIEPGFFDFELVSYMRMISGKSRKEFDRRGYTIELQFSTDLDISLVKPILILPELILKDRNSIEMLRKLKYKLLFYNTYPDDIPSAHFARIRDIVREYLEKKNLLVGMYTNEII